LIYKEEQMARAGRKVSIRSLDEKIAKQQESLAQSKKKYEDEKAGLAELLKLRNELRKEELMEAVVKSDKTFEEILIFIKGTGDV